MNTHCQPLPPQVAEELLQIVTRAMCDRPADNGPQRESRTRQMIHSVLGFEPRDGLEYMLATIAFGHFQLILDSIRDVFQGQSDAMKIKNKTTIVALDRMMLEMIEKLSVVRRRPMAYSSVGIAEQARTAPPEIVPGEPIAARDATEPVATARSATTPPAPRRAPPEAAQPDATPPVIGLTGSGASDHGPAPAAPAVSAVVPLAATQSSASLKDAFADGISGFLAPSGGEEDSGTFEDHIAAFEQAYAATMEVLEEARALELANTEAASGDRSTISSG